MTTEEVDSVLALWRDVEGTEPTELVLHRDHDNHADFMFVLDGNPGYVELSDDQADDLICGHLRRWLEKRCYRIDVSIMTVDGAGARTTCVRFVTNPYGMDMFRDAPTLLLALIAAVRAVAGATGQPKETTK